jgi:hypothetical protein
MTSISSATTHKVKKPPAPAVKKPTAGIGKPISKAGAAKRGSVAPPLKPATLTSPQAVALLKAKSDDEKILHVNKLFRKALGEESALNLSAPHAASTTRDRAGAAADVAMAAKELGILFVLKKCGVLNDMQRMLIPQGVDALLTREGDEEGNAGGGLKASMSALSLASMDTDNDNATYATGNSMGTDTKRGKTTPASAREGALLMIRALCTIVGKPAEPFMVGAFLAAALDECGSSSSSVREAAEDTASAIIKLSNPWAFPLIILPLLKQALHSTEWRVKAAALERLEQCAALMPVQVEHLIPDMVPALTKQVWDTKPQVSKAARSALLAICRTSTNKDVAPTLPAVVNAICKPAETNKAISELMCTTFVVPVDASTLSILCPVLARALKEKLAIHKRAACIVISNMSKLVESPAAIAPFGSLLMPELQKVAMNVQFEEIRDEALKALKSLTKALGDLYSLADEANKAANMENEAAKVDEEQERIKEERLAQEKRDEETRIKEELERKKFKEAMDAQRELDKLAANDEAAIKHQKQVDLVKQRLSVNNADGKCQSCGLKKCRKTCNFYDADKAAAAAAAGN